ncbi:hypothetical protein F8G81_20155 [Arthrobacter sp. CDRTa11]|uniref:hypothetical protein n=1 Tax=Arthrobacter sp. CDRTa11 TaxID=2651199 RepID=UPI002265D0B1|nr:hypothetical protein [Arthrobacter sp. CDRTa11]UZX04652.1 hypothetical protein F8G81_20155 [Arthrobacter sp. CDRTa11]
MGALIDSGSFVIKAWNHVVDFVVQQENGETLRVPLVYTGVRAGPIHLRVEFLESREEADVFDWEDLLELSLALPAGRAYFGESGGADRHEVGTIPAGEEGAYRARLHAMGRDRAFDAPVKSPRERHLVQLWKEPQSPVAVLASGSEHAVGAARLAKMWHQE